MVQHTDWCRGAAEVSIHTIVQEPVQVLSQLQSQDSLLNRPKSSETVSDWFSLHCSVKAEVPCCCWNCCGRWSS